MRAWWIMTVCVLVLAAAWRAEASPIRVLRSDVANHVIPGQIANETVRGTVVLKNEGHATVRGVRVVVHVRDGYGKPLDTVMRDVGTVRPGQAFTVHWQWQNYSRIAVQAVAEVQYEGSSVARYNLAPSGSAPGTSSTPRGMTPGTAPTTGSPPGYNPGSPLPSGTPRGY